MTQTKVQLLDLNGLEAVLDADADTTITADTDDQIDIRIAGADDFQFTANTFTAQSGSTITTPTLGVGNTKDLGAGIHVKVADSSVSAVNSAADELVLDADADSSITSDTDDELHFKAGGNDLLKLTANGLHFPQSGDGIYLGVTSETAANLLDDFEEGTFTPDLDDSSDNSPSSMTAAQGYYTKVGTQVHIQVYVAINSKGSGMTGNVMRISGLPFSGISGLSFQAGPISYVSSFDINSLPVGGTVYAANAFAYLYYTSGDNSGQITPSMVADGTRIAFACSYQTS